MGDWGWAFLITVGGISGGLGAIIATMRGRPPILGFGLGFALSFLGLLIVTLIPPPAPIITKSGRFDTQCPYCNATQNLTPADDHFSCWQCGQATIVHPVGDDGVMQCPSCEKKTRVKPTTIRYTCGCGQRNNVLSSYLSPWE